MATKMLLDERSAEKADATDLERGILCYLSEAGPTDTRSLSSALKVQIDTVYTALVQLRSRELVAIVDRIAQRTGKSFVVWDITTDSEFAPAGPAWLSPTEQIYRYQHEVQTSTGTPDPSVAQGLFKREYREPPRKPRKIDTDCY